MVDKIQDEECINVGLVRDTTGNVQKLRKSTGISIDDQIEIFYEFTGEGVMEKIINTYVDRISSQTKMPVLPMT